MPRTFCIIGAGSVGQALAYLLHHAGWTFIGAASRKFESASEACRFVGDGIPAEDKGELANAADLIFVTTPDEAIAGVCEELADQDAIRPGSVVAHCSGGLSSSILEPARKCGAHIGSLHPLQTLPDPERGVALLPQSKCCVEGDEKAVETLREVVDSLGAEAFTIPTGRKALYHAAAVMACNYLVTLESVAVRMGEEAGMESGTVLEAFLPLIRGTVTNLEDVGLPEEALTGPIARGDVATVRHHMEEIRESMPQLLPLYCELARQTVQVARTGGELDETEAEHMNRLIASVLD